MSLDTILVIGYVLGGLVTFRFATRAVIDEVRSDYLRLGWDDVVMGSLLGLIGGMLWPVVLPFVIFTKLAASPEHGARILAGESPAKKATRMEREQREREQYIRQLERECGIAESGKQWAGKR